ncbi:MAG: hypothetical protein ACKO7W_05935 [Elainella sp.]
MTRIPRATDWVQAWFERLDGSAPQEVGGQLAQQHCRTGLLISLLVPVYFAGLIGLYQFNHPYIVQDDARQHVVFLQRLLDPAAFPADPIADYFTAVAPTGYKALYGLAANLGLPPLTFAQLLPLLLGLVSTYFLYRVAILLWPLALNGVLASLIFNQQLWLNDDLVSATPRAFVYPIFTAFLYFLLRRTLVPCLVTLLLQGLFFPQLLLVQVLMLALKLSWPSEPGRDRRDLLFLGAGLLVAATVLLPYAQSASAFGPVITAAQMRAMPEYGLGGRSEYFGVGPLAFWLLGNSGLRIPVFPSIVLVGFGLPGLRLRRPQLQLLGQLGLASLLLYGLAHLLLLRLHFPSRYTYHSFVIGLSLAAGVVLSWGLERGWRRLRRGRLGRRDQLVLGLTAVVAAVVIAVPAVPALVVRFQGWVIGDQVALYDYLKQVPQPRIASLAEAANSLPAFTGASVLAGREFALPHHPAYYQQFIRRTSDLIQAQYIATPASLADFIQTYGITHFLLDRLAFTPDYLQQQDWLINSVLRDQVTQIRRTQIRRTQIGQTQIGQTQQPAEPPLLMSLIQPCTAVSTAELVLLDAACLRAASPSQARNYSKPRSRDDAPVRPQP